MKKVGEVEEEEKELLIQPPNKMILDAHGSLMSAGLSAPASPKAVKIILHPHSSMSDSDPHSFEPDPNAKEIQTYFTTQFVKLIQGSLQNILAVQNGISDQQFADAIKKTGPQEFLGYFLHRSHESGNLQKPEYVELNAIVTNETIYMRLQEEMIEIFERIHNIAFTDEDVAEAQYGIYKAIEDANPLQNSPQIITTLQRLVKDPKCIELLEFLEPYSDKVAQSCIDQFNNPKIQVKLAIHNLLQLDGQYRLLPSKTYNHPALNILLFLYLAKQQDHGNDIKFNNYLYHIQQIIQADSGLGIVKLRPPKQYIGTHLQNIYNMIQYDETYQLDKVQKIYENIYAEYEIINKTFCGENDPSFVRNVFLFITTSKEWQDSIISYLTQLVRGNFVNDYKHTEWVQLLHTVLVLKDIIESKKSYDSPKDISDYYKNMTFVDFGVISDKGLIQEQSTVDSALFYFNVLQISQDDKDQFNEIVKMYAECYNIKAYDINKILDAQIQARQMRNPIFSFFFVGLPDMQDCDNKNLLESILSEITHIKESIYIITQQQSAQDQKDPEFLQIRQLLQNIAIQTYRLIPKLFITDVYFDPKQTFIQQSDVIPTEFQFNMAELLYSNIYNPYIGSALSSQTYTLLPNFFILENHTMCFDVITPSIWKKLISNISSQDIYKNISSVMKKAFNVFIKSKIIVNPDKPLLCALYVTDEKKLTLKSVADIVEHYQENCYCGLDHSLPETPFYPQLKALSKLNDMLEEYTDIFSATFTASGIYNRYTQQDLATLQTQLLPVFWPQKLTNPESLSKKVINISIMYLNKTSGVCNSLNCLNEAIKKRTSKQTLNVTEFYIARFSESSYNWQGHPYHFTSEATSQKHIEKTDTKTKHNLRLTYDPTITHFENLAKCLEETLADRNKFKKEFVPIFFDNILQFYSRSVIETMFNIWFIDSLSRVLSVHDQKKPFQLQVVLDYIKYVITNDSLRNTKFQAYQSQFEILADVQIKNTQYDFSHLFGNNGQLILVIQDDDIAPISIINDWTMFLRMMA